MTRTCITGLLMLLLAKGADADLRFTTRIEVRSLATATPLEPAIAVAAAMTMRLMPSGETETFIKDTRVRIEIRRAAGSMLKAGTVIIGREAAMFVMDGDSRTHWMLSTLPRPGVFMPGLEPVTTYMRTGEFETIAGIQAERVTFRTTAALPFAPAPRFPTQIVTEGELWVTNRFESYGATVMRALSALGPLRTGAPDGMVLRHITRSSQFGYEIEYTVSDLDEAPLPADLFEIPSDFRGVPPPVVFDGLNFPPGQ